MEADNLATILLSLYVDERQDNERYSVEAQSEIRDRFSSAVDAHSQSYELRGGDLAGALALGLDRGGASGANLVSTVLDHEESDKSEELIPLVVAAGDVLLAPHPAAVARIVANGVWRDDFTEGTTQAILAFHRLMLIACLLRATRNLRRVLQQFVDELGNEGDTTAADAAEAVALDPKEVEQQTQDAATTLLAPFRRSPALMQGPQRQF